MDLTRRDLLKLGGTAIAAGVLARADRLQAEEQPAKLSGAVTKHVLPKLPYGYDALEPHIDAKTMELHHGKHHQAYVDGLNKAESELAKARAASDFALIEHWSKKSAFHGGGHFLHSLFWRTMAPTGKGGGGEPSADLASQIVRDFGSFALFKAHFAAAAKAVEASGWALLAYRGGDQRLLILQVENQHKLSPWEAQPIMGLDVWEHAYYLKYQNRRADYVDAWWNVVNWEQVNAELRACL